MGGWNKMHTVYMFYIYSEYIDLIGNSICLHQYLTDRENTKTLCLYALTDNKKYAKLFQKTRNMKYFVKRIITVHDDEFQDFVDETWDLWMNDFNFNTILNIHGRLHLGYYRVAVPKFEHDSVSIYWDLILGEHIKEIDTLLPDDVSNMILRYNFPMIFNDHYRHMLITLDFFEFLRDQFQNEDELPFLPRVTFDGVAVYLDIYGQLYTDGGFVRLCKCGDFTLTGDR